MPTELLRDFSKGRMTTYSVNNALLPKNSVADSFNVDFSEIVGSGKVRKGTTALGDVVASGKNPLGLSEFVGSSGTPNLLFSVFSGASNATLYYYNGSWTASNLTALNNTAKCRFAVLGDRSFIVNGTDAMKSTADGATWDTTNCITTDSVIPSLIYKYSGRLLASGYSAFKDRVYFSSIIDPNASPTIVWSTNPTTGDWIDVNPDDGNNITGFSDTSNVLLVFKERTFYRMSVITLQVDPEKIYNVGAPSQEAITTCQGICYFFSGEAIYRTNGGFPEQISRYAVQDFIDAIPKANWENVSAVSDEFNVYFSIGQVILNGQTNYIVLKFSIRDENWSVFYYPVIHKSLAVYSDANGRLIRTADASGYVNTLNLGITDKGTPIFYSLETQELEFGDRLATKKITGNFGVFIRNPLGSKLFYKENDRDYQPVNVELLKPIHIIENVNIEAKYLKFKWQGVTSTVRPVFEGLEFPEVKSQGYINDL